ncbi:MAG: 4a-hydroxytetrahydrobiopterin dehydratase [Actinomycetota bacterium]|nr:4a-hydroxytetrahydrobiopterin dehydratase [Actinomycetota bacterium]
MARPTALGPDEIADALRGLPGWELDDGALHREFRFGGFAEAFGFMAAVATVAAEMDHHPNWSNVYSSVTVELSTHDVGGVTELDVQLATRMNELAGR